MTLFQRIMAREIPADIVYEDEHVVAFRDIGPQAPVHLLVVPRKPIARLDLAHDTDAELLGRCLLVAAKVAKQEGLTSFRTVINTGSDAGQSVFHLHLHVLGGRAMSWPPG